MFANQVQVGPEFFAKAKNDYSDWKRAIIREFLQNSIDCRSSRIEVDVATESGKTVLTVENNGRPMDKDELVNKLLALGASGKNCVGTVGGFGKAKEILYFCHDRYQITSGNIRVVGSGAGYDLQQTDKPRLHGTISTVDLSEDCTRELIDHVKNFAVECQWKGVLVLNGEELDTNLRKGRRRRDLGWAVIYTNTTFPHRMIVRVDGMPMFSRYCSLPRCVLVELNRSSIEALQANRDGLKLQYRSKLEAFVDEVTVDGNSALRDPETTYLHYAGMRHTPIAEQHLKELVTAAYATVPQVSVDPEEETTTIAADRQTSYDDTPSSSQIATKVEGGRCSYEFVVKNNTSLRVPDHFSPTYFSAYSRKLVKVWIACLLELHRMFGHSASFAVGFLIDGDREAEHERTDEYGQVYYINPAVIKEQAYSRSRSLRKRWKFNNAGYYKILALAAHEFVHGQGLSPHDGEYANKLTDQIAVVMAQKKRFHPCFR